MALIGGYMIFKSVKELNHHIKANCVFISFGSKGSAYYDKTINRVIKIFDMALNDEEYQYFEYKDMDFLRFKRSLNSTFLFPFDLVYLNDRVVGYTTEVAKGCSLYRTNPLSVNLDSLNSAFVKTLIDTKMISSNGILVDDLPYNTIYYPKREKIYVIDTDDYSFSDLDSSSLYNLNHCQVGNSLKMFLVDGYFDDVVRSNKCLYELYREGDFITFLKEYRKVLSEISSREIVSLSDASLCMDKESSGSYIRLLK